MIILKNTLKKEKKMSKQNKIITYLNNGKLKKHPTRKYESLEEYIRRTVGDYRIIKKVGK